MVLEQSVCSADPVDLLAAAFHRRISRALGACEAALFLGKDPASPSQRGDRPTLLDWIISLSIAAGLIAFGVFAHSKIGTVRKQDQRPHQVPWGLVMIGCVFGLFLVVVHLLNLLGVETGPENSMFGRF